MLFNLATSSARNRASLLVLGVLTACSTTAVLRRAAPPLQLDGTAYEAAAGVQLANTEPAPHDGLHNVFRLSDNIVSGGEPESESALQAIADMGCRTVLSVDGKAPDHESAARYGLRYVHIPIRYRGLENDELLAIAKTFRELDGPFYVHCFHGQHRGPAAAAVGRLLLDGVSRGQAIAEMRQWCGTSSKYEGLYAEIATGRMPSAAETEAFEFDFAPEFQVGGFQQAMVQMTRSWDVIAALSKRDWVPEDSHPDANAANEAAKLAELFGQAAGTERAASELDEFRGWLRESEQASRELADLLKAYERGDADANELAIVKAGEIKQLCATCHSAYRN